MTDCCNVFDQSAKNNIRTHWNIRKTATSPGDVSKVVYLLNYSYFRENYRLVAIDISEQQAHDTGNPDLAGNATTLFSSKDISCSMYVKIN